MAFNKEPWQLTQAEYIKRKPLPKKGKLDPQNQPEQTGRPIMALKLEDGTVYYDTDAKIHADMIDSLGIPPERVLEGGFIHDGKYVQGGADSARIGTQNLAKQKVAHSRAVYRAIEEGKPVPARVLKEYEDAEYFKDIMKPLLRSK